MIAPWLAILSLWGDEDAQERRLLIISLVIMTLFLSMDVLKEVLR